MNNILYQNYDEVKKQKEIANQKVKRYRSIMGIQEKESKRKEFLNMYGNRCVCCGETTYEFLTLEHKLGQRGKKKKDTSHKAYCDATRDYNPDTYEILCYNCNCSKGRYGYCPHHNL